MKHTHVALGMALLLAFGCAGEGDHDAPQSSRLIGFAGGSVVVGDGALAGARATIPPGALVGTILVTIAGAAPPTEGGFSSAGPAFLVAPAGKALLVSATVVVPATPPSGATVLVLFNSGTGPTVLTPTATGTGSVTVTTSTLGTFEAVVVAPIDPAASRLTVNPSSVAVNRASAATITIVVLDVNGVGVPGAAVTLSSTGSGNTIAQPGPTDSMGTATGSLVSTTAETKTLSASVVAASGGAPVTLTAMPTVTFK